MLAMNQLSTMLLELLVGVSVRALCLAAIAGLILLCLRRRTAQLEHATWTIVLVSMLLLPALAYVAPAIHIAGLPDKINVPFEKRTNTRVYNSKPIILDFATQTITDTRQLAAYTPTLRDGIAGLYLLVSFILVGRLILGLALAKRLVSRSTALRSCEANRALEDVAFQQSVAYPLPDIAESEGVRVPCVIEGERPTILLPVEWRTWDSCKLQAVLAHELTHVRRGDWHCILLAAFNRCIYWFHPLSWWLERRLASLAEQACDDGSLIVVADRKRYAKALLEVASDAREGGVGHITALLPAARMASAHPVARRIDRVLESRTYSSGVLSARGWLAVAMCVTPFVCVLAAAQAPTPRPVQPRTAIGSAWINEGFKITAAEAQDFEAQLARNPEDLRARASLMSYYLYNALTEPLSKHVLWVIEHHPDSDLAEHPGSIGYVPNDNYVSQKKALWLMQASKFSNNPRVLGNAAAYLRNSDPPAAERLMKRAYELEPGNAVWRTRLAGLLAQMIQADSYFRIGANLLRMWPEANPSYAAQVKSEVFASQDAALVGETGRQVAALLLSRIYGSTDQEQLYLQARRSMGSDAEALLARARSLDPNSVAWTEGIKVLEQVRQLDQKLQTPPPVASTAPSVASSSANRIQVGSALQESKLIENPQPEYPALAQQARIQGVVRLNVVVGTDGRPINIRLQSGHPLLVPAATDVVRRWRYQPTLLDGTPVEVETVVDVNFSLNR